MHPIISQITASQVKTDIAPFKVGDGVRVHTKVREGDKERIQVYSGIVIARKGGGIHETFTVRRISYGEGVERVFPVNSPNIEKVEVERESEVMRSRLYYLRTRTGKAAVAVKEREFRAKVVAAPVVVAPSPAPATPPPSPLRAEGERIKISPLAKKLVGAKSLDPALIKGTGPGGRIVRADVLAAEANGSAKIGSAPQSSGAGSKSQIGGLAAKGPIQEERTAPVSNMRGVIAKRLIESKTTAPHFYLEIEVDAEPLAAIRTQLNTGLEKSGVKLSVNDFILKASAEALRRVPDVNASWEGTQIRYFGSAHVSFAVALPDGLITPIVRDAHEKSVFQISTEAKALGKLAKDKKLKPDQYTGGTFCVSNLGMMGIPRFLPIINTPNAAILGVGAAITKPVVKNGQLAVGSTMTLTLSCDHRVVDGAVGAQFLGALKLLLESPALLLV